MKFCFALIYAYILAITCELMRDITVIQNLTNIIDENNCMIFRLRNLELYR